MMEPSGIMDQKTKHSDTPHGKFTVCDLTDEEVHFSRNSSDYYYQLGADSISQSTSQQVNSNNQELHFDDTANYSFDTSTSSHEQVKSNKLLQTLGNKLRRGSNYLNAPTRLVGHYLLGITIQSWSEFFQTSRLMKTPHTRHQLTRRLVTNLNHFQGNYLCVSLILVLYCILTSPLLLLAIVAYLFALYLVTVRSALGKQTRIFNYRLNLQQQYSFITMLSLPPLWIAGAPSAVFWVIGASFFVVGLHASMYASDQIMIANGQLTAPEMPNEHSVIGHHHHQMANNHQQYATDLNRSMNSKRSAAATVQYYNHYPTAYTSLPHQLTVAPTTTTTTTQQQTGSSTTTGGSSSYVSSTISQWITFGSGKGKYIPACDSEQANSSSWSSSGSSSAHQKVPDVKIISRDYAGLGRVYEV